MNKLFKEISKFLSSSKKPLLVILGPTASGKTALSIKLAKQFNAEIISTDSRQIYKKMPISTALVTKEEAQGIKHHLIEITPPDKAITLQQYKAKALKAIEKIYSKNKLPILVGGTGLYISAIIENYQIPKVKPNLKLRAKLEKIAEKDSTKALHEILEKLDPDSAKKIHSHNIRYVIRAIEIAKTLKTIKVDKKSQPLYDTFIIFINWPRKELYKRIEERVDIMMNNGLLAEISSLIKDGYNLSLPSMTSVGVKEIIPYIEGKITLDEATDTLKRNTRRYAKRQLTWFKRYKKVYEILPEELKNILCP